jgi:hypothetical protein
MTTPWRRAMAEANNAPPPPPETRTPLSPINGRRRRLSAKGAPKPAAPKTATEAPKRAAAPKTAPKQSKTPPLAAGLTPTPRGELVDGATLAAVFDTPPPPTPVAAPPEFTLCREIGEAASAVAPDNEAAALRAALAAARQETAAAQSRSAATAQLLDALRDAHESRLEVARRRVKDLEFELQARKGRDEARSPEVQRQRQRAEAFRQEAAQARGALDAERAARDAADALAADSRGEAFVADDVADAAAATAAAREARLWNAHVALVEKRDEEAKQLAELVDERDAYEAANRALATRVARLDKEAAERDAREREIADELALARASSMRVKHAIVAAAVAAASAAVGSMTIFARR